MKLEINGKNCINVRFFLKLIAEQHSKEYSVLVETYECIRRCGCHVTWLLTNHERRRGGGGESGYDAAAGRVRE